MESLPSRTRVLGCGWFKRVDLNLASSACKLECLECLHEIKYLRYPYESELKGLTLGRITQAFMSKATRCEVIVFFCDLSLGTEPVDGFDV